MLYLFILPLSALSIYSYALIDPNLTFFQSKWWEVFRERMVYFGYYQRDISWIVYLLLVVILFVFHHYFIKKSKQFNPITIAFIVGVILVFSYPFLSHDFFNYMFDAKIATFYHQNPYVHKALDFPSDQWLRFMHWTHRTYPYGPTFLLITLIPSVLSFGKFVLSFFLFKLTFILFYGISVYLLNKLNRRWAMFFATNPLILIEGLVNSHNDLIAVCLGIVGVYYLFKKKTVLSRFFLLFSAVIKYVTFPTIFLTKGNKNLNKIIFLAIVGLVIYLSVTSEIQPWYFLNLFLFLPFYEKIINELWIFFSGLLISYYSYIRLGGWDSVDKVNMKHWIIVVFLLVNILIIFLRQFMLFKSIFVSNKRN